MKYWAGYGKVFDELESEANSLNVTESAVCADREKTLAKHQKASFDYSIENFESLKPRLSVWRKLSKLLHFCQSETSCFREGMKVNEPEAYYINECERQRSATKQSWRIT